MATVPYRGGRILLNASARGIESRPVDAVEAVPALASVLEGFRATGGRSGPLAFVHFAGRVALTGRVERSAVNPDDAWLEVQPGPLPLRLTRRELDIVSLMCVGMSYARIAAALHVAPRTVRTHAEHIFTKLSVDNRSEAVAIALDGGAVRLPLPAPSESDTLLARWDRATRAHMVGASGREAIRHGVARPAVATVGCLYPLDQLEGQDMLLGARLAADEINAAGGVGDHAVELVALGVDVASIDSIRSGLHRLTSMNVDAVAFGYAETRDSVRSLLDDWGDAGMPLLHSLTSHEADEIVATGHGRYSNVFQVCPSDNFYGDQFLRFLSRALPGDAGREIVMVSDDPQMIGYHPLWADKAARAGYRMWLRELVVEGDAEHAAAEIVEQDPVAVFLACFRSTALKRFMRRFLSGPSRSLVYALWAPGTSDFRQELHSVEGLVWSTSTGKYSDQIGKGFEARFASRFGRGVFGTSASIQYDSISLLAHAWRRAGRTSSYTRTMDELRALVHRGVNGSYFFGSDLQRSLAYGLESRDASLSQAHLTYQVQDGMNRIIGPRPYAETRYLPQPWLAAGPRSRMPES